MVGLFEPDGGDTGVGDLFGDGARNVFGDHGVAQALNTINVVEIDHSVVFDKIFNYGFDVFFFGDGGVDNDLISGLI